MFIASTATPYVQAFPVGSFGAAVGSAWANPGTLPTGAAYSLAVHPSGNYLAVGHATTPFMSLYPVSAAGAFGTKLTNPGTLPAGQCNGVAFSPQGDFIAAASTTSPFIQVWAFTDNSGSGTIGAAAANPGTLPASTGYTGGRPIAWRPQGDLIAMGMSSAPYLYLVPFNRSTGTFGAPITSFPTLAAGVRSVNWSPCGSYLFMADNGAGLVIFSYFNGVFTLVTLDGFAPGGACYDVQCRRDNSAFFLVTAASVLSQWATPRRAKSYIKILGPLKGGYYG